MTETARRALTDEERDACRAQLRELVTASVAQLRTSEGWRGYLTARRTFHHYCWLI